MKKIIIVSFLLFFNGYSIYAQKLGNLKANILGDSVIITYQVDYEYNEKFTIEIFASIDDYNEPLHEVYGQVGQNVNLQEENQIVWYPKREVGEFKGNIDFQVKGFMEVKPINFPKNEIGKINRKDQLEFIWTGGRPDKLYSAFVLHNGEKVKELSNIQNNRQYTLNDLSGLKPNKSYQFGILQGEQIVTSPSFRIKPKFPLWIKASPIVLGGTLFLLFNKKEPIESGALPIAPDTPTSN